MNWYKKYLFAVRKIFLPPNIYDRLEELVDKIAIGHKDWTPEDLQLQQNYPEALEALLKKKLEHH